MSSPRPIPLTLLPSALLWKAPADSSEGMGGEYEQEQLTMNVRFEPTTARAKSGSESMYETYEGSSGTVFIDAVNSVGDVPPLGSVVSIDGGIEMVVRSVTPLYGFGNKLHHTELEVG